MRPGPLCWNQEHGRRRLEPSPCGFLRELATGCKLLLTASWSQFPGHGFCTRFRQPEARSGRLFLLGEKCGQAGCGGIPGLRLSPWNAGLACFSFPRRLLYTAGGPCPVWKWEDAERNSFPVPAYSRFAGWGARVMENRDVCLRRARQYLEPDFLFSSPNGYGCCF